jgi:hypothetical protein
MGSELEENKHLLPHNFLDKIILVDGPLLSQCWQWTAAKDGCGYAMGSLKHKWLRAHRLSYMRIIGPIPDDKELDHLCRNRLCINPFHLEPVTHIVNVSRGNAGVWESQKTHCSKGHPFDETNTYFYRTGKYLKRGCLICRRERSAVLNDRRKLNG